MGREGQWGGRAGKEIELGGMLQHISTVLSRWFVASDISSVGERDWHVRGPVQMWKECSFGNLPPGPGNYFPLRLFSWLCEQ